MTSNNLRELAKQGDPKVISSIINHSLQKKGINVQVTKDNDSLEVTLESDKIANQQASLVEFIRTGIVKLGVESIDTVKVYGVQTGDETPVWEEEIFLGTPPKSNISELEEESEAEDFPETVDELDPELENVYETETDEDYYEEGEYDEEVEYEDNEDDEEELSEQPQSQKKKIPLIPILLGFVLVVVGTLAALHFSGIFPLPFLSQSKSENTKSNEANSSTPETSPSDPQSKESPKTTETTPADSNPWYFGVTSAQSAAQKAQTAKTKSEWNAVATDWQKAVDLMKKVPESDPNYQTAQTKVLEYQNNLDIAKQRADKAPN
ncbi:MAG: hypothetical protein F6K40_08150 [Okeania sp. SIO3I5]|uniref:hypothetical protein n=1 Tax=Okeania sp. SIO3I5 TaxID=2607805 RepID=UPI0013BD6AB1|nr:hypothetical protein [Okeania sp. SIO3I5]NEQ36256.1 hypothetical protein [Okeania sp. SIO3I5]